MKKEITCSVVGDLLPLYVDNVLSDDSRSLVEEHLDECSTCRKVCDSMKSTLVIKNDSDHSNIKNMKRKIGTTKFAAVTGTFLAFIIVIILSCTISCIYLNEKAGSLPKVQIFIIITLSSMIVISAIIGWILFFHYSVRIKNSDDENAAKKFRIKTVCIYSALILLFAVFFLEFKLMFLGNAASNSNISFSKEFQYSSDSYLNQEWVFHLSTEDGKPLNTFTSVQDNSNTYNVIYYVREVPLKGMLESNSYTAGYSTSGVNDERSVGDQLNFYITIVYKDRIDVYDMRSEGVFEKQDNVKYKPEKSTTPDTPISGRPVQDSTIRTVDNYTDVYD